MIFCTTKVRDELLEMGKDMKVMHSVSSLPTKYGGTFSVKRLCMRKQTFLGKFMEGGGGGGGGGGAGDILHGD